MEYYDRKMLINFFKSMDSFMSEELYDEILRNKIKRKKLINIFLKYNDILMSEDIIY